MCWCDLYSGLEPKGVCALAPARFTVETFSAGRGDVYIEIIGPDGNPAEVVILLPYIYN